MILTREQIKSADDRPRELVNVPQWGGAVYVASMTAGEKAKWEADIIARQESGKDRLENIRVRLAIRCTEDADGKPLFDDSDLEWLITKNAAAIEAIANVAARINALTKQDEDAILKNSQQTPQDNSSCASLAT